MMFMRRLITFIRLYGTLTAAAWLLPAVNATGQQTPAASVDSHGVITVTEAGGVQVYTTRHPATGRVTAIRRQGFFNGCGVPVGTDSLFSLKGKLYRTVTHEHRAGKTSGSCHDLQTVSRTTDYHPNGRVKQLSQHRACYDCEPVPCGVWKTFDATGRLRRQEIKGDCGD